MTKPYWIIGRGGERSEKLYFPPDPFTEPFADVAAAMMRVKGAELVYQWRVPPDVEQIAECVRRNESLVVLPECIQIAKLA